MRLINKGKQASVYLTNEGNVLWVPDQSSRNDNVFVGWRLCMERLSPPHFPEIYSVSEKSILMEFVEGVILDEWNAVEAGHILDELGAAHIFHRDIRLSNLRRRPGGAWCLLDFGWACDYDDQYFAPWFLGAEGRKGRGIQDDAYAMEIVERGLRQT